MTVTQIERRDLPEQHTAAVRHQIAMSETSNIPKWIEQTFEAVRDTTGAEPTGMPFVRTFSYDGGHMDIEVGWILDQPFPGKDDVQPSTLPAGPAAVGTYLGPYTHISEAYEQIEAWCTEHGHTAADGPWECYLNGPDDEPDSAKWCTDVYFPIEP